MVIKVCLTLQFYHFAGDDGPCVKGANLCRFGAICVVKPNGEPSCECPTCTEEFKPICGRYGCIVGIDYDLCLTATEYRIRMSAK